MSPITQKRDEFVVVDNDRALWWYSPTAQVVKWSILGVIVLFFILWFVIGYFHAQRRLKKGLPPLLYHRFLVPRSQRPYPDNAMKSSFYSMDNQGYGAPYFQQAPPPTYQPPERPSKGNPAQEYEISPLHFPPPLSAVRHSRIDSPSSTRTGRSSLGPALQARLVNLIPVRVRRNHGAK